MSVSNTTPFKPREAHLYNVEMCGFLPARRRGSSLVASANVTMVSLANLITVLTRFRTNKTHHKHGEF